MSRVGAAETDPQLAERLAGDVTLWDLACALLAHWRAALPAAPAREANDEAYDRWSDTVRAAQLRFDGRDEPDECSHEDVAWVLQATDDGCDADAVDATAWGIATVASHTFAPAWRDRLGGGRHVLAAGEPYPVADAPWDGHGRRLAARPPSRTPPAVDELPTIRIHDGSFTATVDFSSERTLEALAVTLGEIVTCHPNVRWDEFAFPRVGQRVFPVGPADPARQHTRVLDLVERALARRPQAIVLPELSTTPEIVDALEMRLRDVDEPCLVVAGSFHRVHGGVAENRAVGLVSGGEERMEHRKSVPFSDELRLAPAMKEGIARVAPFELTVHQADRFRVAIVVCKELLTAHVGSCLDRMGVNLLFVPAMSLRTDAFREAVSERVARAQALTVVANGPLQGPTAEALEPAVVVGQPVEPSQVDVNVRERGLAVLRLPL